MCFHFLGEKWKSVLKIVFYKKSSFQNFISFSKIPKITFLCQTSHYYVENKKKSKLLSFNCFYTEYKNSYHIWKKIFYGPFFMDGVQLPQRYSHFEEAIYFLPFSSQKFLVLILSTSEGWKAESTLEPPSGFEHGTPGLGIQCLNH